MKKIACLIISALFSTLASAQTPAPNHATSGVYVGFPARYPAQGMTSQALSASGNRVACGINLGSTKTLSKVKVYLSGTTGTPTAAGSELTLRTDSSGLPNASATETKTLAGAPSGAGWYEFTGFTTSLTRSTQYWLVLRNGTATPASNYQTVGFPATSSSATVPPFGGSGNSSTQGWPMRVSTDSGSTYGTNYPSVCNFRLEFSDGTFEGFPVSAINLDSTNNSYGTREVGVQCTVPSGWPTMRVVGLAWPMNSAGAPGAARYGIWTGSSPASPIYTDTMSYAVAPSGSEQWFALYFSSTQTYSASTVITATIGTASGGDSSNYHRTYFYTVENDANSKALKPLGTCKKAFFNGSTWTYTDTDFAAFSLILDPTQPFSAGSSVGSQRSGTNPGLN